MESRDERRWDRVEEVKNIVTRWVAVGLTITGKVGPVTTVEAKLMLENDNVGIG
jgi:hypothetical protein